MLQYALGFRNGRKNMNTLRDENDMNNEIQPMREERSLFLDPCPFGGIISEYISLPTAEMLLNVVTGAYTF